MKIFRVVVYDGAFAYYHFGSKREASENVRQFKKDFRGEDVSIEIEPLEVTPTRDGIAKVLQDLVHYTCMNE